jgi:UDPglucose 6-dehydrogenase
MRVSVVGTGKLGLVLACILAKAGHEVTAADLSEEVINSLRKGVCPIRETNLAELLDRVDLTATTDVAEAARTTEVTYIVVPTPSDSGDEFSNDAVLTALTSVGEGIRKKVGAHTVVVVSTVMPGASETYLIPALEKASGRTIGTLLNYAYSPEFIALGSVISDMYSPDFILIGQSNKRAGDVVAHICHTYLKANVPIIRLSVIDAEIAKISLNCFLTVKISFANMISEFCESFTGSSAAAVCGAIGADSRVGPKFLRPGTASAGPCLPRDLRALSSAFNSKGISAELVDAALSVNDRQVSRLKTLVKKYKPKKVAILGVSYKPNTHITDASVGLALLARLKMAGIDVRGYDPMATFPNQVKSAGQIIKDADVIVITTAWPEFAQIDYGDRVVIDCWDVAKIGSRIYQLGQG